MEEEHEGGGNIPRGEGPKDDANGHDESKAENRCAAKNDKGKENQKGRSRGDGRATEGRIESTIDDEGKGFVRGEAYLFADSIEDDDRVVERVADNQHDGRNSVEIDLKGNAAGMKEAHQT